MTKFIDFYFDFSSPYAYIGYKEIKKLEKKNSFKIKFMPIFLGGLHNAAGITPAAFIKLKSKYMIEDTKLVSKKKNISFHFNSYFPIKTVNFMRGVLIAEKDNSEKNFIEKIFNAIWMDGLNMNDPIVINKVLKNIDLNPEIFLKKVSDQKVKDKLRKLTDDALKKKIFGVPAFVVNKKMFWGQDRLSYAIDEIKK
jgi:2-hydroxychromene-2-carboxylate isomerase|tara:strand:- start:202 stop:789 length:588 start_codon:yes stop_codon:yes gene_type:complete